MKSLNFVTNEKGERIALQIPIPANITIEYLEDVEDVLYYELLKDAPSIDYESSVKKIIANKKAEKGV